MSQTLYTLTIAGKYPRNSLQYKKRSLAADCNNEAEMKRLKKFDAMFGNNSKNIKLPNYSK